MCTQTFLLVRRVKLDLRRTATVAREGRQGRLSANLLLATATRTLKFCARTRFMEARGRGKRRAERPAETGPARAGKAILLYVYVAVTKDLETRLASSRTRIIPPPTRSCVGPAELLLLNTVHMARIDKLQPVYKALGP